MEDNPLEGSDPAEYFHSIPLEKVTTRFDRRNSSAFDKAYDEARERIPNEKDVKVMVRGSYLIFWPEDEEPN